MKAQILIVDTTVLPISTVIRRRCFSFQNSAKNLDPSYKTDIDLSDCLERVKLVLPQKFIRLIKLFVDILERRKLRLIAE